MADPVTMIGAGAGIASSLLGAFGAEKAASAKSQQDQYLAGVARINAQIDRANADRDLQAGGIAGMEEGLKSAQQIADTKARQGASGFITDTGSNAQVTADQTKASQFDQDVIAWKTQIAAYGDNTKAATADSSAGMYSAASANDSAAGDIGALSSVLGGVTSVATRWTQSANAFGNANSSIGTFSGGGMNGAPPTWG